MTIRCGWSIRLAAGTTASLILGAVAATPAGVATTQEPVAEFRVVGSGVDTTYRFDAGSNLILCTTEAGWADLWIRLAQERSGGDGGAHLDIDVCGYEGGGVYRPQDPRAARCVGGKSFDLWWHEGAGGDFANVAGAPRCSLSLRHDGDSLFGLFRCPDLDEADGDETRSVAEGSFRCTIE